jgi:peptide/nickel transport system permease protein
MAKLVIQRLAMGVLTILVISVIVFAGTEILPGDVVTAVLGQGASNVDVSAIRQQMHLDQPAAERYLTWLFALVTGDLGKSLASDVPISDLIGIRLPYTLRLAGATAILAVPLSVIMGLCAAMRAGSWFDRTISSATVVFLSGPEFLIGTLLVLVFAVQLRWFPAISFSSEPVGLMDHVRSMALPVLTLTAAIAAPMTRMTRSALLTVLTSPPMEMAILKGLSRRYIVLVHALPNALPPIITVIALNLAYLVTGVVIVEVVFNYPGMGKLLIDAVGARDIPVVQACAMIFCLAFVTLNLGADLLALAVNPKRRYPK